LYKPEEEERRKLQTTDQRARLILVLETAIYKILRAKRLTMVHLGPTRSPRMATLHAERRVNGRLTDEDLVYGRYKGKVRRADHDLRVISLR
jgi:hypothetical protein